MGKSKCSLVVGWCVGLAEGQRQKKKIIEERSVLQKEGQRKKTRRTASGVHGAKPGWAGGSVR